jgi:MOSC domain-containing protein YiiM|tara:strand:+ start:228 stop:887 length:660 start_codon:yes stop_codon:yes gene_type:complete
MKVLSINISEPKKIVFNGKELTTSIYKMPVEESAEISEHGINGDRQADLKVHGGYDKALYGYSFKHYKKWSEDLGVNFKNFGLVGENLTIDDFDEKKINIGDEIRIGNCVFQVSQPRIPCYKLGIKMNNREFPKMFSQSCLLGIYLRIVKTGKIFVNDTVEIIKQEPNSLSIFEISELLFKDLTNKGKMKEALNLKYLSEEIKEKFRERLMKLGDFESI